MNIRPTAAEAAAFAQSGQYRSLPVSTEILADVKTPIEVLRILQNVSGHCFLLESAEDNKQWGRYTFLGFEPKLELACLNGTVYQNGSPIACAHPNDAIRAVLAENKSPRLPYLPPFAGGLVGYFAYDYIKYFEPTLNLDAKDTEGFRDVDLMLFDKLIAFDNLRQKIILIVNMPLDDVETNYPAAVRELHRMADLIRHGTPAPENPGKMTTEFQPLFTEQQFCAMVEKAKHHIRMGDIFQIVPSNRLEAGYTGSLLNAYRILRTLNPSPYMFYSNFQ